MMISRTPNATTIHSGLNTHNQLHSMTLHSFNTKNTMNSTHMMPIPPDDFSFITVFFNHRLHGLLRFLFRIDILREELRHSLCKLVAFEVEMPFISTTGDWESKNPNDKDNYIDNGSQIPQEQQPQDPSRQWQTFCIVILEVIQGRIKYRASTSLPVTIHLLAVRVGVSPHPQRNHESDYTKYNPAHHFTNLLGSSNIPCPP